MKSAIIFLLTLSFSISCRNKVIDNYNVESCSELDKEHMKIHEEMNRASDSLQDYEVMIKSLYKESISSPDIVIKKTDELIKKAIKEKDPCNIRWNKLGYLYDLRAELLYKNGRYQESIQEVRKGILNDTTLFDDTATRGNFVLACNLMKLNRFSEAKKIIEENGKGYYITGYVLGTYYETIKDIKTAKSYYSEILKSDRTHYLHYDYAKARMSELNKSNPKLLTEIFLPTTEPNVKITKE